jgi:hypothetical protein
VIGGIAGAGCRNVSRRARFPATHLIDSGRIDIRASQGGLK